MNSQRGQSADDKILIVAETDSASESWIAIGPDERDEAVAVFQHVDFSAAASVHPLRSVSGVPPALEPRRPLRTAEGWS